MPTRRVLATIAFALLASCSTAKEPIRPLGSVDYQRDGKLIMAQVKVNGRGPYWFLVDSGASRSVIDPTLAQELGVNVASQTSITGTGAGKVAAAIAEPIRIAIGGSEYRSEPYIIDLSGAPMSDEIRGLVGSELFASHIVRLDPMRQQISWYAPDRPPALGKGAVLPLKSTAGKLYLPATIEPRPGQRIQRDLRIDTGSESSVNDPSAADAPLVSATTLGNGLGENFEGVSGKYHSIAIGPYRFNQIWGPGGNPPLIGMELLQRFVITFDAPHGRIHLSPLGRLDRPVPHPPGTVRENPARGSTGS
jgi:predicted aspartyl protease